MLVLVGERNGVQTRGQPRSSGVVEGELPNILWGTPFRQMISGQGGTVIQQLSTK